MFSTWFCSGQYFELGWEYDNILNKIITRQLSTYRAASLSQCTWTLLRDYNYEKFWEIYDQWASTRPVKSVASGQLKNGQQKHKNEDVELQNTNTGMSIVDENIYPQHGNNLFLNFLPGKTHIINATSSRQSSEPLSVNTAPVVSLQAGLELLSPMDLQVNIAGTHLCPIIFDTGASLAITGDRNDFLPDTYEEVTTLRLGGMASGAPITGKGNVA